MPLTYSPMVSNKGHPHSLQPETIPGSTHPKHASASTLPRGANTPQPLADTVTHASSVSKQDTDKIAALSKIDMAYGM
jgi:hypothetical protein